MKRLKTPSPLYPAILMFMLFALCPLASTQKAKTTASVTIEVRDPGPSGGAPIPHARIRIVPHDASLKLETGPDGNLTVELSPGTYDIIVMASGFSKSKKEIIIPDVSNHEISVVLQVGSSSSPEVIRPAWTADETDIWKLEDDYWAFVKGFDSEGYKGLWHSNSLAWHDDGYGPIDKNRIQEWVEQNRARGLHLEEVAVGRDDIRIIGNVAITYYWVTTLWIDKDGRGEPRTSRFTHTWMKTGNTWQIIGEMSTEYSPKALY